MPSSLRLAPALLAVALALGLFPLMGCEPALEYPITDGFHNALPKPKARVVVWGIEPSAAGAAMTWLQKRGLAIVERARLQEVLNEQMIRLTHTSDDDAALLRVGRLLGADLIVFVEAGSTKSVASSSEMYVGAYGGYGESSSVPVHSSVVNVRAVDIQTGEVVWSGTARYPTMDTGAPEDSFVKLTCQALATAWGFRPAGQREIPSQSMCAIEAPIPVN